MLLSPRRVGPTGFAYGLDMTDEMLAIAEQNRRGRGVQNVRFLKGHIEQIPLPNDGVDVVISNCVINLSGDKPTVLREAFRVLKPGGRFAVSDVVVQGDLPAELRTSLELWAGCIAGALEESTYRQLLAEAGFLNIAVEVTRVYDAQDLAASECCGDSPATRAGFSDLPVARVLGGRRPFLFSLGRQGVAYVEQRMGTHTPRVRRFTWRGERELRARRMRVRDPDGKYGALRRAAGPVVHNSRWTDYLFATFEAWNWRTLLSRDGATRAASSTTACCTPRSPMTRPRPPAGAADTTESG